METLTWKDNSIAESFSDCKSLSDIVRTIETENRGLGKVICKVIVNGMVFSEVDEQRFSQNSISEIQTLDVELMDIRQLVQETDGSTVSYAKGLVESTLTVAEGFRGKDLSGTHSLFKSLLESVESLMQASELSILVRKQEGMYVSPKLEELNSRFIVILSQILQSYEKRDFILTADLLEYDLAQAYNDLIKALEENLNRSIRSAKEHTVD